jgi:hypothetical protein
MATADHPALRSLQRWHHREDHPVWFRAFSEPQQERLVDDDLSAGYSVAGLLVCVVTLGLMLIAGSVLIVVL